MPIHFRKYVNNLKDIINNNVFNAYEIDKAHKHNNYFNINNNRYKPSIYAYNEDDRKKNKDDPSSKYKLNNCHRISLVKNVIVPMIMIVQRIKNTI